MARRIESTHALLEQVAYQMASGIDDRLLGGHLALLKVQATQTVEFCAREASQILGGNSCLRTGVGAKVERIYREVRTMAIGGGSEEVRLAALPGAPHARTDHERPCRATSSALSSTVIHRLNLYWRAASAVIWALQ